MDEEVEEMLESVDGLVKEVFESQKKMKSFLITLSQMYNTSYSNILLLKKQRPNVSLVADKNTIEQCNFHLKKNEQPLKIIKRVRTTQEKAFRIAEVYDISQTDGVKKEEKPYSKEYIEKMLKGMCSRRGIKFQPNNTMANVEHIIMDIKDNTRPDNMGRYSDIDEYARQIVTECDATSFVISRKLNISTKDDNLKNICKWGIEKDNLAIMKESLKYIQKYSYFFIKDFQKQEKLCNLENEKQDEDELE